LPDNCFYKVSES